MEDSNNMKIDIQGHACKVTFSDPGDWSSNGMGRANTETGELLINNQMGKDFKRSTLMHEILHIISSNNDLALTEQQVSVLGVALSQLINCNPDLIRYINQL